MKESREEYDGRIVECVWAEDRPGWRMTRFRDDKPHGNHKSTVEKVLESIADGVEMDAVLARQDSIRAAWKHRSNKRDRTHKFRGGPPHAYRPPHMRAQPPPPAAVAGIRR